MPTCVKEWMSADPVAIEPDASAQQALELMIEHGIRHLPVVEARGRLVGVVSIDDLRAALPLSTASHKVGLEIGAGRVGELMTFEPHCVRTETPLAEAADRMAELRIGCLPVVDGEGALIGILSETDALRALAATLWTDEVRARRCVETELDTLVARLREERERIARAHQEYADASRRFATHPREEAVDFSERASDTSEAESAAILENLSARRLESLDLALERATAGQLGLCASCGRRIPLARLQALPGTTLCIACARKQEG